MKIFILFISFFISSSVFAIEKYYLKAKFTEYKSSDHFSQIWYLIPLEFKNIDSISCFFDEVIYDKQMLVKLTGMTNIIRFDEDVRKVLNMKINYQNIINQIENSFSAIKYSTYYKSMRIELSIVSLDIEVQKMRYTKFNSFKIVYDSFYKLETTSPLEYYVPISLKQQ